MYTKIKEVVYTSGKYRLATIYIFLIAILPNLDASSYFLTFEGIYVTAFQLFNMIKFLNCVQF